MNINDLRSKTMAELKAMLAQSQDEQMTLRFQLVTKNLKRHHLVRVNRRDVARIKTVIRELERIA